MINVKCVLVGASGAAQKEVFLSLRKDADGFFPRSDTPDTSPFPDMLYAPIHLSIPISAQPCYIRSYFFRVRYRASHFEDFNCCSALFSLSFHLLKLGYYDL